MMKRHKNQPDARPAHGLAFHEQRGVRSLPLLKSGWRWLTDAEAVAFKERGEWPPVALLVKVGVMRRAPGAGWRKWRGA